MRILAVAGASGGHIFPALGFLDTLHETHKEIDALLVLPKKQSAVFQGVPEYKISYIPISPIKLSLEFKNFIAILGFFKGFLASLFLFIEFKPDIVVGFGSLACVPLVMLAWLFRIKSLIHEQNLIPGRANKFLAKFTDRIAVSFPRTTDYFKNCRERIVFTGNPIRKKLIRIDKHKALDFFGFHDDKITILVTGGSQGSHRINTGFLNAITRMPDKNKLQIIHISGPRDCDYLERGYRELHVNAKPFVFLEDMQYAYSACDFVLSRAGATTIAELIFFKLPAVIVPYPYAYRHQWGNARVLEEKACACVIPEEALDGTTLMETLENFINIPDRLKSMRSSYDSFPALDTNALFTDSVLALYNE